MTEDLVLPGILQRKALWLLLLVALLIGAVTAFLRTPVEVLPPFDFPQISVIAHLPGATASEMEHLLVNPLESQILTLPGLKSVRSTMGNGTVEINVRFDATTRAQFDLQAVNGAIDRARTDLPGQVRPLAEIMGNAINEVADYTARLPTGMAPAELQHTVENDLLPALRAIPGVQFVNVFGSGDEVLWIQPDLDAIQRYAVGIRQIVQAVQAQVLLAPAGFVTVGHNDVMIEARHLPVSIQALEAVRIITPAGLVPLSAVAHIVRTGAPVHSAVALDGQPSVAISIIKQPGASTLRVSHAVQGVLQAFQSRSPEGVRWVETYNQGRLVGLVGADLGRDLVVGAVLAVLLMFWVLGTGRGIVVLAMSIPLSMLLAIAGLHLLGQGLNLMTLGALSVAVGLLADDAIIVLESIYHRWESGDAHWRGIWAGVSGIVIPDLTGTLSNVAIYLPLLFVGGIAGLFFVPFSLAMIVALLSSLFVSLTFVPMALGFFGARPVVARGSGQHFLSRLQVWNEWLFNRVSRSPRLSLALTFAVLLASLAGMVLVPVNFLPLPNEGALLVSFTLPPGASLLETRSVAQVMSRRLLRDPSVDHVFVRIGSDASTSYTEPAYSGEIQVTLKPGISVDALDAIGERIRHETALSGVQLAVDTPTIERVGESLSGLPQPFVIHLFGPNLDQLRRLSGQITTRLRRIDGLSDVFNNDGYPVSQLQLEPDSLALSVHGMTPADLYAQIGPLLNGQVISRVPAGNVPLDLYVRLADASDRSLDELARLPVQTKSGWTPLAELARIRMVATPNQIEHIAGARALDILATPAGPLGSTEAAARSALAGLAMPPGYRIAFGGMAAEMEQAAWGLVLAAVAAFALMLAILLVQFEGWLVPGILLLEIPLALTGGSVALVLTGTGLNATGMIGFLTLIGIGLRHSIVLLDRVQHNEKAGLPVEQAVMEAIRLRFRPIMLTAMTAVAGMLPIAAGLGEGAAPEQGLAVVIAGGLIWSAVRSTNLIPALYLHWRGHQSVV